ncbi:MAG: hypothetical protein GY845_34910 [Planctomycetes bacterium]|nr:hypothetical protein [Planctomycetota bacterium]
MSPDTIVPEPFNPQSLNRYSYCLNNPLKYVDPSGHNPDPEDNPDWEVEVITLPDGSTVTHYYPAGTDPDTDQATNVAGGVVSNPAAGIVVDTSPIAPIGKIDWSIPKLITTIEPGSFSNWEDWDWGEQTDPGPQWEQDDGTRGLSEDELRSKYLDTLYDNPVGECVESLTVGVVDSSFEVPNAVGITSQGGAGHQEVMMATEQGLLSVGIICPECAFAVGVLYLLFVAMDD